jgi:hypothetical protein
MLVLNHSNVKEVSPKKGTLVTLDDSDDIDELKGRSKGMPDVQKMDKDREEENRGHKFEGENYQADEVKGEIDG